MTPYESYMAKVAGWQDVLRKGYDAVVDAAKAGGPHAAKALQLADLHMPQAQRVMDAAIDMRQKAPGLIHDLKDRSDAENGNHLLALGAVGAAGLMGGKLLADRSQERAAN